jgi:hypothetical protein
MVRKIAPIVGLSAPREHHKDVPHTATKAKSASSLRPISGRFKWSSMRVFCVADARGNLRCSCDDS